MEEIWKDIAGYEGLYHVSNLGRVKSIERVVARNNGCPYTAKEKILTPAVASAGYPTVSLCKNGVKKQHLVHRLVAEAFIPNGDLFALTVNHIDEDKTNNVVSNLEWMSMGDNARYSHRDGGTSDWKGSKSPKAKQVRCMETGQVFGCAADASRWLGLREKAVATDIRRGVRSGGYHFEYVNNDKQTAI